MTVRNPALISGPLISRGWLRSSGRDPVAGSVRRKRSFDRGLVARHTQLLNTLH